jgi:ABC-type antimicrobial peptide transport system permease subunit
MLAELRAVANAEVPRLPITALFTLSARREDERHTLMMIAYGIGAAGLIMLFLSAMSLYAVVSFAVGRRNREIGIRTALGAQRTQVVCVFVASGVRLSLLGLVIGLPLGLIGLRVVVQDADFQAVSRGLITLLVGLGVLAVAGLATWLPARRAASVDPLTALRSE